MKVALIEQRHCARYDLSVIPLKAYPAAVQASTQLSTSEAPADRSFIVANVPEVGENS